MNPREEIKDMAPRLSQWKHNEGYTVPPDYFNNFSDIVLDRVQETEKLEPYFHSLPNHVLNKIKQEEKGKVVVIRSYFKYGVAAAILLAVGSILWTNVIEVTVAPTYVMVESSEDLEYIIEEISMEDIFSSEFIDDESLDEILVNGEEQSFVDDLAEDLLFNADDYLLEEFL